MGGTTPSTCPRSGRTPATGHIPPLQFLSPNFTHSFSKIGSSGDFMHRVWMQEKNVGLESDHYHHTIEISYISMINTYLIPPYWIRDDGLSVIDNDPVILCMELKEK